MDITRLEPAYKDYIWGGNRLNTLFGKHSGLERTAESWELSLHPDGECRVRDGTFTGLTLSEAIDRDGRKETLGAKCDTFTFFPVLIKLIDAKNDLSVQVHPSDAYALSHEGQYGKTEMWYVIDADEGAKLVYGFNRDITAGEMKKSAENGSIEELLNYVDVKKGDVFFIESGTVHAIGKGLLIAEIQQNSNLTYRLYDYGRPGADGKPRQLHIEKAAAVAKLNRTVFRETPRTVNILGDLTSERLCSCEYFTTDKITVNGIGNVKEKDTFVSLTVLEGEGSLEGLRLKAGDTVFIPASAGKAVINGSITALKTFIA